MILSFSCSFPNRLGQILPFHFRGGHATIWHISALCSQETSPCWLPTSFTDPIPPRIASWPAQLKLVGAWVLGLEERQLYFTLALVPGWRNWVGSLGYGPCYPSKALLSKMQTFILTCRKEALIALFIKFPHSSVNAISMIDTDLMNNIEIWIKQLQCFFNTRDPQCQGVLMMYLDTVSAEGNCKPQFCENLRDWGEKSWCAVPPLCSLWDTPERVSCLLIFSQLSLDPPRMGRLSEFWENKSLL